LTKSNVKVLVYGDYGGVMSEDVMDTIPIKQMNDCAISKWVKKLQRARIVIA
jgi:hypothetical protein